MPSSDNSSAIEVRSAVKNYGGRLAVNNCSFTVRKGEMFALVGPDGAGKTTIIRMLCGITPPTEGEMSVLGFDVRKEIAEIRRRIGYLSQRFSLYGDLTIDENIEFFAEIHGVKNYQQRRNELLTMMRLAEFRSRFAEKLSGGMKQKLALACTLIHTPDLIFLDEPTTGVDPVSRRDFWIILSRLLRDGITIMITTPYLDEAERCHRVAMMIDGGIMKTDSPENLKAQMKGEMIELVSADIRRSFSLLKDHPGIIEVQAYGDRLHIRAAEGKNIREPVAELFRSQSIEIMQWRRIEPSLENVFISMMTERGSA